MAQLVIREGKTGVVAGLNWSSLDGGFGDTQVNHASVIRERADDVDAKLVTVVSLGNHAALGAGGVDDLDGDDPPKIQHSLAAMLCHYIWANSENPSAENVVVCYVLSGSGRMAQSDRCAVVVIDAGLPILDEIHKLEDAQNVASKFLSGANGFSNYKLLSNDLQSYPSGDLINDDQIMAHLGKETKLKSPPVDLKQLLAVLAVFLVIAGSMFWYFKIYKPEQVRKENIRKAAMANPVPKYQAALLEQIDKLGVSRASMLKVVDKIEQYPVWLNGWVLKEMMCEKGSCAATWERRGGTLDALHAARPQDELTLGFNTAVLRFPVDMTLQGVKDRMDVMEKDVATSKSTNIFQVWENAKISVTGAGAGYAVWPSGDYVVGDLPQEIVIKSQPLEVRTAFPLVKELITSSPQDAWWSSIKVVFSAGDKSNPLNAELKGASYVR